MRGDRHGRRRRAGQLALPVTVLHVVIVLGLNPLTKRRTARLAGSVRLHITCLQGQGVLTRILHTCDRNQWALQEVTTDADGGVLLTVSGAGIRHAPTEVAGVDGVTSVRRLEDKDQ